MGAPEPPLSPAPVERAVVPLSALKVGMKAFVEKDGEKRKAEILAIKSIKSALHFYVHYEEFNKRLDEWIPSSRLDLEQEVEWTVPKQAGGSDKKGEKGNKRGKNQKAGRVAKNARVGKAGRKSIGRTSKEAESPTDDGDTSLAQDGSDQDMDGDLVDIDNAAKQAAGKTAAGDDFNREDEIEKLRTGGSMTQNQAEISRMRNLMKIQMGKHEIEPWYFSPYPIEFSDVELVYICEFCLCYYGSLKQFTRHRMRCKMTHPPGNEIYRDDYVCFFEIDGQRQRTWCRNLCLLSKLFLDHKALYYDVDPFLFYCMCIQDEYGYHLVGYFSKEKESADGFNVACILTLPQYQRKGFGKLLIAFSYELSKREGKLGSPEKPLSDLGLLSYRAYWQEVIVEMLVDGRTEANVEELGYKAAMTTNDVLHTLHHLNIVKTDKSNRFILVIPDAVLSLFLKMKERQKKKGRRFIDPEKLQWKPPVFHAGTRTWNW